MAQTAQLNQRNQRNQANERQGQPDDSYQSYQRTRGNGVLTWKQVRDMKTPPWLIEGILPAKALSMVYGYTSTYKSFWVLDMALCVASGREWHGHRVQQGDVMYVAGEAQDEYGNREAAWMKQHRIKALPNFYMYRHRVRMWHDDSSRRRFMEDVEEMNIHPSLVIFDTYSTVLGGADENTNGDSRIVLDNLDDIRSRWKCAVLVVHHSSGVSGSGNSAIPSRAVQLKQRPRGAQALADACAMVAHLVRDGEGAELICTKQRGAPLFAPIQRAMRTVEVDYGETSLTFADQYATGPRAHARRISWADVKAVLEHAIAPMTPKEIADALDLGPSGRKRVQQQLRLHANEVYHPMSSRGYLLISTERVSPLIMPSAHQLVA